MRTKILGLLAVGLLAGPMAARAGAVFTFQEVGPDLKGTLSGSLVLSGASRTDSTNCGLGELANLFQLGPRQGLVIAGADAPCDAYSFSRDATQFGTGGTTSASGYSGDLFWAFADAGLVAVPRGYVFGANLTGSVTLAGRSFSSFGLTVGDHVWALPNDTITFRVTRTSAPEPGTFALLGLGLAGLGLSRRRRTA